MKQLVLQPVPNQRFSAVLGGIIWEITVKACGESIAVDLVADGETVVTGQRVVCGRMIIPYKYKALGGNFAIITATDEPISWRKFGANQHMYYLTPAELDELLELSRA